MFRIAEVTYCRRKLGSPRTWRSPTSSCAAYLKLLPKAPSTRTIYISILNIRLGPDNLQKILKISIPVYILYV